MRRFFYGMFALIGFLVVLAALAGAGFALWARSGGPRIADNTVLALDLTGGFPDMPKGMLHRPALADWIVDHAKATAPLVVWLARNVR